MTADWHTMPRPLFKAVLHLELLLIQNYKQQMRLFIEFFVEDIKRSKEFYVNALGMTLTKDYPGHVQLDLDKTQINLCQKSSIKKGNYLFNIIDHLIASRVEVCLEVADLDKAFKLAKEAGADILEPIKKQSWNRTDFRMKDPDRVYLRVTTPVI